LAWTSHGRAGLNVVTGSYKDEFAQMGAWPEGVCAARSTIPWAIRQTFSTPSFNTITSHHIASFPNQTSLYYSANIHHQPCFQGSISS
jgi:hypothetical protein